MVFKRRDTRPLTRLAVEMVYPKGGWRRAAHYILHRLRRLPDSPERIARGFFAGVFISFTPLFGFHFIGAVLIAWAYRGNIIAALLGTFVGNPLTTPLMATMSLETGYWLLGEGYRLPLPEVFRAFGEAAAQLSRNVIAFLTAGDTEWDQLAKFFHRVYLPFLIGSPIPGIVVGLMFQFGSLPLIRAYQRLRTRAAKERMLRRATELGHAGTVQASFKASAADAAPADPGAPAPQPPAGFRPGAAALPPPAAATVSEAGAPLLPQPSDQHPDATSEDKGASTGPSAGTSAGPDAGGGTGESTGAALGGSTAARDASGTKTKDGSLTDDATSTGTDTDTPPERR